ncbi:hypothetical protein Bpfe_002661 [Biomphalaria pfeifferi]|uniref:Peptidase S1 domain-containing protein n=1 Tax=Biomphalaria pfeifferi TaxID=112525 RepID=A0AAD8FKM1_BIOPF|nr:hypothetical protein Bpfe_002661 [Biomphalaria pfeifferi]
MEDPSTQSVKTNSDQNTDSNDTLKYQGRYRGRHEIGLCPEVVASPTKVLNCEKKIKHKEFIPYKMFSMMNFPEHYRDIDLLQIVHIIAFLTVKIIVKGVSQDRPLFDESGHPYPLAEFRGSEESHFGTGRIGTIWSYSENDDKPCPCSKCQNSGNPTKVWGLIRVITAVHVVFDQKEAIRSECLFGFDSLDAVLTLLEGVGMERADKNDDRCHLSCVTHDVSLLQKIKPKWSSYPIYHSNVLKKFTALDDKLVIIVAHPHGCPKQVSIGDWTYRDETGDKSSEGHPYVKYNYTTATCQGSSGATLYILGRKWKLWYNQIHSGYDSNNRFNYSGTGCD